MKNLEILPFINIKNLEKEIKDNLFQLNKDELIINKCSLWLIKKENKLCL